MMRRSAARLRLLLGTLAVFCARPVLAEESACSPMAVEADASVSAHWPRLLYRVHKALDSRGDIDACARVGLRMSGSSVVVEVVLADGRSASRPLWRQEDVVPTIEALLLLPERHAKLEAAPLEPAFSSQAPVPAGAPLRTAPPASSPAVDPPLEGGPAIADRAGRAPTPADPANDVRIELSVLSGARMGDGQTSFGLGALSFVDVDGWLMGFGGRADRYQTVTPGRDRPAVELAALGGRRFRFGALALDITSGPALVLRGGTMTSVVNETSANAPTGVSTTPQTVATSNEVIMPRLLAGARLVLGARSLLRVFVGIDGELGPSGLSDAVFSAERALPVWTLGLALGATVGTP